MAIIMIAVQINEGRKMKRAKTTLIPIQICVRKLFSLRQAARIPLIENDKRSRKGLFFIR